MKYLYIALIACLVAASDAAACTSAIVSGRVTANGRPLLWKHRDTGAGDNKVERIAATDSTFEYVALFKLFAIHNCLPIVDPIIPHPRPFVKYLVFIAYYA